MVGAGVTGAKLAGELSDCTAGVTRPRVGAYPRLNGIANVVLVYGGTNLLAQFEPNLREETIRSMNRRGIDVRINTRITGVGGDGTVRYGTVSLITKGRRDQSSHRMVLPLPLRK